VDERISRSAPEHLQDPERGERIAADEMEAGISFVHSNGRSDPPMPFGGVKESGYGREGSQFGIREFTTIRSVLVEI
jgi:succinate-semialdehyde dehydrogenase/glutarate-semialdehyde dehydrogenase